MKSLVWIVVISTASACSCPSSIVPFTQLGDGNCDPRCMSLSCNFDAQPDNLSDCESACEAAGCDLSVLGDGTCDSACEMQTCGLDFGDCGVCAPGCSAVQLANGKCDSPCNFPACNWDSETCECAPGCSSAQRTSQTTNVLCCSAQCQYQTFNSDCLQESCAPGCPNRNVNDGLCDSACFNADCAWDGWDCQCAPGCSSSMQGDGICNRECATEDCEFDQGDCPREEVYVGSQASGNGSGKNSANAASSLSNALSQLSKPLASIYLLQGLFLLSTPTSTSRLQDPLQPLSRLKPSEMPASLLITTLRCTGSNTPAGCSPVRSTLRLTSSLVHFSVSAELILKELVVEGEVSLKQGCSDCTYCPVLRLWKGVLVDDRGQRQSEADWPEASACKAYHDFALFTVTGTFKAENVAFEAFRMQPRALIELQGGRVLLTSVDFHSITPAMTNSPSAVLLQRSAYQGGSVLYTGGSVSWLNDRTEYRADLPLHGFLDLEGLISLEIADVVFSYNVVSGHNTNSLLQIGSILQVQINQCEFKWNLVKDGLLQVKLNRLPLSPLVREGKLRDSYLVHINCADITVENNYAQSVLFRFLYSTDLHTILLSRMDFQANTGGSLVHIELTGPLLPGLITTEVSEVQVSARSITLQSISITSNYCSLDLIVLINLPNLVVRGLTLDSNQDMRDTGPNELVLPYFQGQDCYLSLDLPVPYTSHCPHGVRIAKGVNVQLADWELVYSDCRYGAIDVLISGSRGEVSISGLTILGNSGHTANSTGLRLENLEVVTATSLTFSSNENRAEKGAAGLFLSQVASASVAESVFEGNVADQGAALLVQLTQQVILHACDFIANSANIGGAVFATLAEFNITNCTFLKNSAESHGGALALLSTTSEAMQFTLKNTQMANNMAGDNGAALYIEGNMESSSLVQDCIFTSNRAVGLGGVYVSYSTGKLTFTKCRFTSNTAEEGSALYIQASTSLQQLIISDNKGVSAVFLGSGHTVSQHLEMRSNAGRAVECSGDWSDFASTYSNNQAGALLLRKGTMRFSQAFFLANLNPEDGGAVKAQEEASFFCTNCTFRENASSGKGGALFISNGALASLSSVILSKNQAEQGSAAFFLDTYAVQSIITMSALHSTNSEQSFVLMAASVLLTASDLSAWKVGILASFLTVKDCKLANRTELIAEAGSLVEMTNTSMKTGQIRMAESTLHLQDCRFQQCSGVCLTAREDSQVSIHNCTYEYFLSDGLSLSHSNASLVDVTFQIYLGSAVRASVQSFLSLAFCSFASGTTAGMGAGLRLEDSSCQANTCTFSNLEASAGGAIWTSASSAAQLNVTNSKFTGNKAAKGGSLWAGEVYSELRKSKFTGNQAEEGGAVYFNCEVECALVIDSDLFEDNEARTAGGAIRWTQRKPQIDFATMKRNSSPYGPDFASFARKLIGVSKSGTLLESVLTSTLPIAVTLSEVSSGAAVNITLAVLDHYGNVVRVDNSTECWVKATDTDLVTLQGVSRVTARMGRCYFTDLRAVARPGYSYFLEAGSALLSSVLVRLEVRNCSSGEEVRDEQCHSCGLGSFSMQPGTLCMPCPTGASCYGGVALLPKAGYWRASNQSEKVSACVQPSACTGRAVSVEEMNVCEEGYEGKLCGSCGLGYARTGFANCRQCLKEGASAALLVLSSLAVAAAVYKAAIIPESELLPWLKVLLSHVQLLLLVTQFNLNYPKQLTRAAQLLGQIVLLPEQVFAHHCLYQLPSDSNSGAAFFRRLVAACLFPLVAIGCAAVLWGVQSCRTRNTVLLKRKLVSSAFVVLYMATPSLTAVLMEAWACVEVQGEHWQVSNTVVKCYEGLSFFALGAALLWGFALPVLCLSLLCTRHSCSFLVAGYQAKAYFWEFVLYAVKLSVALFATFLPASPLLQASCGLLALVAGLYLQLSVKPAATWELQQAALVSLQSLCALLWTALILHIYEGANWLWMGCFCAGTVAFLLLWVVRSWPFVKPLLPCFRPKIPSDDFSDYIIRQGKDLPIPTRLELCISYLKTASQPAVPSFSPKIQQKAHLYASPSPKKPHKHKREEGATAVEVVLEESKEDFLPKRRHKKTLSRYNSEAQAASKGVFALSPFSER